jgi:hypothetical protein
MATRCVILKMKRSGRVKVFIALQIHEGGGIRVKWKNIEVEELP